MSNDELRNFIDAAKALLGSLEQPTWVPCCDETPRCCHDSAPFQLNWDDEEPAADAYETFTRAGQALFSEKKAEADAELLNDHPDGWRPLLRLQDDGTGSFTTPPFPLERAITKDDILDIYSLDKNDWIVTSMEVLSRWAWFRDEMGQDAVTRPCHQYRGKVASKTALNGPESPWGVVNVVDPVKVTLSFPTRAKNPTTTTVVIFPDQQIGYGFYPDGTYYTTHHTEALSTALLISADANANIIANVGDIFDFAPWSDKYLPPPEQAFSTQAALECGHSMFAIQAELADLVLATEGNHEARLIRNIMKNAREAYKLMMAGDTSKWPVLSLQHLLQTDALGVEWYAGYGNGYWLRDDLVISHGKTLAMKKQSQKPITASTISGHIHRAEMQSRTYTGLGGREMQTIHFSPGTLARTTGEVPSTTSSTDEFGKPIRHVEDWQLGLGVVTFCDDLSIPPTWEMIPISPQGKACWRGKLYSPDVEIIELLDIRSIDLANQKRSPR